MLWTHYSRAIDLVSLIDVPALELILHVVSEFALERCPVESLTGLACALGPVLHLKPALEATSDLEFACGLIPALEHSPMLTALQYSSEETLAREISEKLICLCLRSSIAFMKSFLL